MTLQELVKWIKDVSLSNRMVKGFSYGYYSDFREFPRDYPFVFLNPSTHIRQGSTIRYNFEYIVADLLNDYSPSHDKELLIHDRAIKITNDTLSKIDGTTYSIDFTRGRSLNTFVERFDDSVSGLGFDLEIVSTQGLDKCDSPFNNFTNNEFLSNIKAIDLYTLVNKIRQLCLEHKMIKSFYYGTLSDIKFNELDKVDYPYVFLLPSSHSIDTQHITYRFNMIVCDLVKGDAFSDTADIDEKLAITSNTMEYIDDVMSNLYYSQSFYELDISRNYTMRSFVERFDDEVAGTTAAIEIKIKQGLNLCDAPLL
jgi:hypothetical protein